MIKENGTILVPFDFSRQSMVGLMNSYNIARFTKSKILLVNILKNNEDVNYFELTNLCKKVRFNYNIECDFKSVFKSNLYSDIIQMTQYIDVSLVVMGLTPDVIIRNLMGFGKFASFIKKLKCPIITCRSVHFESGCETIVFPLDLSPESREKVNTTLQLAKFYDAEVKIVSVFNSQKPMLENRLLPYVHQVKKIINKHYVFCSNKTIDSRNIPISVIEYASKSKADLIIQMNERNSNFKKWFRGNSSLEIINSTNIPVLTINPMKRESISTGIH
jgi:nucleotide-binding universal stress UspA family protein